MKERIIYFLEKPIFLSDEKTKKGFFTISFTSEAVFKEAIAILMKTPNKGVHICSNGAENLWESFKENFKIIVAAGGLVTNSKNEILFIKRLGIWDLPKGKLEKGEKTKPAAIREVEEETGISVSQLNHKIMTTYHIIPTKINKQILKKVVWYHMFSEHKKKPIPQTEEGIEEVKWLSEEKAIKIKDKTYKNISLLLDRFYTKDASKTSSK
jgi:8-oxo-dGTP pyrophosphatase MutT (NUDIX family)